MFRVEFVDREVLARGIEGRIATEPTMQVKGRQRFASGNFGQGGSFEVRVSRPGVIDYECTIHPATMNGAIEVVS